MRKLNIWMKPHVVSAWRQTCVKFRHAFNMKCRWYHYDFFFFIIIYMLVFKYYSREYTHKFLKLLCAWLLGTTGKPKGVTISHEALIIQSLAKIAIVGYSEDDVCHSLLHPVYVNLPLYRNMRLSTLSTIKILHNCIVNQAETKHSHVK